MLGHLTSTQKGIPFAHALKATPNADTTKEEITVKPTNGTLNQKPKIVYTFGTDFTSKGKLVSKNYSKYLETITKALKLDTGAQLQARTLLSSRVTAYSLKITGESGDPNYDPAKDVTPTFKTNWKAIHNIKTKLGNTTVKTTTFDTSGSDWSKITPKALEGVLSSSTLEMFSYLDESFIGYQWLVVPDSTKTTSKSGTTTTITLWKPGADYYLEVEYRADTQVRLLYKDGTALTVDYGSTDPSKDTSFKNYNIKTSDKYTAPISLTKAFIHDTKTTEYAPATDKIAYKYTKKPGSESETTESIKKEDMPYAVYSSSPEAYAELKNWGIASDDEPGDTTGLGDGRSPVDTEAGVLSGSNGSDYISEDYEAMSGVATTEKLYLAVGGSEFIVDIAVQYVPNETAVRAYKSHFDGMNCQFNYEGASGSGADIPEYAHWNNNSIPQASAGNASVSGSFSHTGGTITYKASGSIDASGSASKTGGGGSASGGPWSLSVVSAATHGDTTSGEVKVTPNGGDVAEFNAVMHDLEAWIGAMQGWISGIPAFTSGSDQTTRSIGANEVGDFKFSIKDNSGKQGASGSMSVSAPSKLWYVEDDGTDTSFNLVSFSGGSMSVTNPHDLSASASSSCITHDEQQGDPPVTVTIHDGDSAGSSSASQSKPTWTVTASFTLKPHVLCGPCCGHVLPEINDLWQQSYNYDYLKIIGLSVLRLDQGAAADTTIDGSGLKALIGTDKLGVTRQTFYSSPSYNIAQMNIFNYMGLQTDGTKDVNSATNEYFRSIAVGSGTYGQTQSSAAGRVKYWITDSDSSKITAKGPAFERLIYEGNTLQSQSPYSNELNSSWDLDNGLNKANDYVEYNFGSRSNLCDGTSRGYQYNLNKSSWVTKVDGVWKGKKAYDLPWATGFIYDGIGAGNKNGATSTTTIGMKGFSVSESYENAGTGTRYSGKWQGSAKGWDGKGVTSGALTSTKVEAYEEDFTYADTGITMKYSIGLDWSDSLHNSPYADTRQLVSPGGLTNPNTTSGDVSPRKTASDTFTDSGAEGNNPYTDDEFLTSYTNKAPEAQDTIEYKLMLEKRKELVQATVLSDILTLDMSNGIMPISYHYKNASFPAQVDDRIPDTRVSFDELWLANSLTPNGWTANSEDSIKDAIQICSYNGVLGTTVTDGNQTKLRERSDAISGLVIKTSAIESAESASGKIGKELNPITLSGKNINAYLKRGSSLQVPKYFTGSKKSNSLLYNISPIVLSAENKAYDPGIAEAFWETIVLWKDSSNHDYYSPYADPGVELTKYLADGDFIRLPELLGNYGQVLRDEEEHTVDNGEELLQDYFIDTKGNEAYGATQAREAQAEQYGRGFSVTGYNYDKTNTEEIDGFTNADFYNESSDLTGDALTTAYSSSGMAFIMDGMFDKNFNTATAAKTLGKPKVTSGYIQQAAYTRNEANSDTYKLNSIIIHDPISARAVQIMPIAEWRDQRVYGQSEVAKVRKFSSVGCPGVAELCDFAVLNCEYDKDMTFLELNFKGNGNKVANTALHAQTVGDIIFSGNFICTSDGLTSGGSTRTGVTLDSLGADYSSSLNFKVTVTDVLYSSSDKEQMLFAFDKYGVTLDPKTKTVFIRVFGSSTFIAVNGEFNSGDDLIVELGSANAAYSKVWINGVLKTLDIRAFTGDSDNSSTAGTTSALAIGSGEIGNSFWIGAWNVAGASSYALTQNTRIGSLKLERMHGSHEHNASCGTIKIQHVGGNNTHIHDISHLGNKDDTLYLNGTLTDYANGNISDAVLKERLGDAVYEALMNLAKKQVLISEIVIADNTFTSQDFSYTGSSQGFIAPATGTYTFEVWGAEGGTSGYGGKGGYSKGSYTLTKGQTVYVYVGGQTGFNGGGSGHGRDTDSGGGATDIRVGGSSLSNRIIVAGGGGGWGSHSSAPGGAGGGVTGGAGTKRCGTPGTGGTQTSGGTGGTNGGGKGSSGYGGSNTSGTNSGGGGGGGGYYGGGAGGNDYPNYKDLDDSGGGGGSGYIGGVSTGSMSSGVRSGNGFARVSYSATSGTIKSYTITVPEGAFYQFDAEAGRISGGQPTLTLTKKGSTIASGTYDGTSTVLSARLSSGTYELIAGYNSGSNTSYALVATITPSFTFDDVIGLEDSSGNALWRNIPFYLGDGNRNPIWACNGEANAHVCIDCVEEISYDSCTEPHHMGQHYDNDICFDPCMNDALHNQNYVQDRNVNSPAAEFVSIDWDYTLYASSLDNFRSTKNYQLTALSEKTGRGYIADEDTVRFMRGKYVRFPWYTLYEGVLYSPNTWITLGDRGTYISGETSDSSGFGGDVQDSDGALWDGEQAAAYNVQNWSLYDQQIYHDLYKDFYDFYVPLANDELSLGECIYATVAVNTGEEGQNRSKGDGPSMLSEVKLWGINNAHRVKYATEHGSSKLYYVDLVGRIGGYVIEDTTDVKFSNTFKEASEMVKAAVFAPDPNGLYGYEALDKSDKAVASLEGVTLKSVGDWVGFTGFNVDNQRNFTIAVSGSGLKACELEVEIDDADNGGSYVYRLSDMTITENTDSKLVVTLSAKNSNSSILLSPKLRLIGDTEAFVSSITLNYGTEGHSYGFSTDVDATRQNYYVTDVTDVRGVYLNSTLNTSNSDSEDWVRYGTYTSLGRADNWVELQNKTQVRDSQNISQRNTPTYGTRAVNTYGTRTWVQDTDPFYLAWKNAGGRALLGPLTSEYNVIEQYQTPEDQLSIGTNVLFDITTLGNYFSTSARLEIIPTYYALDLSDGNAKLTPVDVYQLSGAGNYAVVNNFGAPYDTTLSSEELDKYNSYRLNINWDEEAVGDNNRRNVTAREYDATEELSDTYRTPIYEGDSIITDEGILPGTPTGEYTVSTRKLPSGVMSIGGSQLISQNYQTQTFIGSNRTYGVAKDGGTFSGASGTDHPRYLYWEVSAQRWHSTLGLPSDSVFVPLKETASGYEHRDKTEIEKEKLDIKTTMIIAYIDVYAYGTVWTLRYGRDDIQRKIVVDGQEFPLPDPPPPYENNTYDPSVTSKAYPGIPFVVFGGGRTPEMADIIKVN